MKVTLKKKEITLRKAFNDTDKFNKGDLILSIAYKYFHSGLYKMEDVLAAKEVEIIKNGQSEIFPVIRIKKGRNNVILVLKEKFLQEII